MDLPFDAQFAYVESVLGWLGLVSQPMRGPADEVGGKRDEALLQIDRWLGADFDVVQVEDLFALLDAGLNRLSGIVLLEPSWQVVCDRV